MGLLHFGYAQRYAQAYYAVLPDRILIFPDTPRPVFMDLAVAVVVITGG